MITHRDAYYREFPDFPQPKGSVFTHRCILPRIPGIPTTARAPVQMCMHATENSGNSHYRKGPCADVNTTENSGNSHYRKGPYADVYACYREFREFPLPKGLVCRCVCMLPRIPGIPTTKRVRMLYILPRIPEIPTTARVRMQM